MTSATNDVNSRSVKSVVRAFQRNSSKRDKVYIKKHHYYSNLIWYTVSRLMDELISSYHRHERVSYDPMVSAHPLDVILLLQE